MGDAADALTESGIEEWTLHLSGWCDTKDPCRYCLEEDEKREKEARRRKKVNKKK